MRLPISVLFLGSEKPFFSCALAPELQKKQSLRRVLNVIYIVGEKNILFVEDVFPGRMRAARRMQKRLNRVKWY